MEDKVTNPCQQMVNNFVALGVDSYRWLAENGIGFDSRLDSRTDEVLSAWRKRAKPRRRQCYKNSQLLACSKPEYTYWEGFWCDEGVGIPIAHAWNVRDNQVVDLTADTLLAEMVIEEPRHTWYFGVPIATDWLESALFRDRVHCDFLTHWIYWKTTGEMAPFLSEKPKRRNK